ncbi:aminotransferase class I/II-fold pyridoxal phosphate-dependent enzyme [Romboutsia maritimum]|uniref:Aminotransferase class I/II-fold pyridoxal phosphate-dependent enzyme n=1 Tax=Romboutsia maritimum TaxID=2020948 RepID=A0A371IQM5_9FIRM|nr:aminotransferase class I/II-fold pyridoxal phosphate-dependent enzyme [Romboutsia maritimum]RDY22774.1 aminotransferase class I/II-fold pyridoxal phosphate-dependent enzyme [Romboutsia maritimum]
MKELGHGADVNNIASIYNIDPKNIIDFSSNINPNVIPNLDKYVIEGLKECRSYPDISYMNLRKNISEYINVNKDFIIPGNGATEIIYLLMKSINKRLAILNPTFSEYKRAAILNNLEVIDLQLNKENNFEVNIELIKENIDSFDSLFICNPNNPNGKVKYLQELLNVIKQNNKLLIVDETFMEFVENEEDYSLIKYINQYENLFIIKAVTKFFGLPGLRLGYAVTSNKNLIEKIYNYKEPWTINSFADNLSNYIFKDSEYIKTSKNYYVKERSYMIKALKGINNLKVYDTDTNFILLELTNKKSKQLKDELLKDKNILIRDASNFIGLDERFIRVAIKSHEENEILIKQMKVALGD